MKRKMCRFVTIFCLSIFFFSLTITAHASTESQALVVEGRALLFNSGNPTYSGILSANAKFEEAATAGPADQEANLFYAVTRLLASGLEQGGGTGLETVRDLLEAFGISRNDVDLVDAGAPFNEPPEIYDHYDPPDTIPGGENVRAFLAGPFVTLLDAAIDNLDAIPYTTSNITTLLSTEIDDDHDVEVDYGDVLLFKSALYTLKSAILIMTAYDLDIDFRELTVLGNAGVLQIQRDLLDKYSSLLNLRADGAASLADAKQALFAGINAYEAAFNFITAESPPSQGNELFYFESDEDQREADLFLTQLTELKNSLDNNQATVFTTIDETWIFTDTTTSDQLKAEIEKDLNEKFVWGDYWGLNGCDFISCGGWVEEITVSGTSVTIKVGYPQGSAIFNGTFTDETHIEGTYTEYDGSGTETGSGDSFTATRQSREIETEIIDFNLIFGNTDKSPLDIRAILPEFDQYNEPVPGTFGTPILNGIVPEFATNDDLTREMNLQPSGFFNIPTVADGAISVDGISSDWSSEFLAFTDLVDDEDENANFVGTDIHKFYLAKDSTYLYIGIDLYDGDPKADNASGYVFQANQSHDRHSTLGDRIASVWYHNGDWIPNVGERTWPEQQPIQINSYPSSYAAAGNKFIEWKVLLDDMGNLSGRFINVYSHFMGSYDYSVYPLSDSNLTAIILDTVSISGTITCSAHNNSGNIFICARDASTGKKLGKTYITYPATSYTITGLPVGAIVNLFARWDADDNGIKTFGDYVGMTGPITVASGGTTGADFSINTLIDDSFIMTKPGVYRVFGSNTYNVPQYYYGPWDPNEIAWDRSEWTFIGESNKTETFSTAQYYKTILMVWHENSSFNFDAIEDQIAGTAFTIDEYGNSAGYNWVTSGLRNFDADQWTEPSYFKGHPDGLYARTQDWYGFNLFPMPDDSIDISTRRQLKITLVLTGDVNGDNDVDLADAILALKVVAGMNPAGVNLGADVNGDAKIGLAEVIYILQYVAGLR